MSELSAYSNICLICHHLWDIRSLNITKAKSTKKLHATFCVGICNMALSLTAFDISRYRLNNVIDSNVRSWKSRSRTLRIGMRTYFVDMQRMQKLALLGQAVCCRRLFVTDLRTHNASSNIPIPQERCKYNCMISAQLKHTYILRIILLIIILNRMEVISQFI